MNKNLARILVIISIISISIFTNSSLSRAQNKTLNISTNNSSIENLQGIESVNSLQNTLRSIATNITPGVVSIEVQGSKAIPESLSSDPFFRYFFGGRQELERQYNSVGSGFIITPDGYLFSNWHVVQDASLIRVTLADGRSFEAQLIGADTELDIALLKIEATNLSVVPIGDSDEAQVGDLVVAIGNPFGLAGTFTFGTVSGLGREGLIPGLQSFIQTDAAVNPGNSGGPLLNIKGQAIGINTAIRSQSGGYEGISFAIPINVAYNIAEQLFSTQTIRRGFLGIVPQELDNISKKSLGLDPDEGIVVSSLDSRGPAASSGLQQGDIITKIDNKKISSPAQLTSIVASKAPGSGIDVEILRNGKRSSLIVTLGTRPSSIVRGNSPDSTNNNNNNNNTNPSTSITFQGATFSIPSPNDLQRNGATEGVVVTRVDRNSTLAFILSQGDIIASVNNYPTPDIQTFEEVTNNLSNAQSFAFAIYKRGYLVYRSIEF